MYKKFFKRLFDVFFSFLFILLLIPVFLTIAICIYLSMGKPIFFAQTRIGQGEKLFKMYKFRTMQPITSEACYGEEFQRLTKLGKLLRSTSLDEIPELFNIFLGHMSFVGPRPLPDYYLPYFYDKERKRHSVRGGLIPPDSISKKAFTTWEEQFYYDLFYVDNMRFLIDIKIVTNTFLILLERVFKRYGEQFRPHLNEYRKDLSNGSKNSTTSD